MAQVEDCKICGSTVMLNSKGQCPSCGKYPNDPKAVEMEKNKIDIMVHIDAGYHKGQSREEIIEATLRNGYKEKDIIAAINEYGTKEIIRLSEAYGKNMVIGGAIAAVGLTITVLTYLAASESGGFYIVAHGAIVWGIIQLVVGYAQYRKAKKALGI